MFTEPYATQLIQLALKSQGFDPGPIDGKAGARTSSAFTAYVAANQPAPVQVMNYRRYQDDLSPGQRTDMVGFKANWLRNMMRYSQVASLAQIPSALVAALHWRESTGNFKTYLHQGDPLGKPAVHVPKDIPVFTNWEPAAVHALKMKESLRTRLGINFYTVDLDLLCDFAENYNGLGYRHKGLPSPYVLAGTTGYEKGKFVADHEYDPNVVDRQLGVLPMLRACGLS